MHPIVVTGAHVPEHQHALAELDTGYAVGLLERDPNNEYDEYAIRVLVDGTKIGHVPHHVARKWSPTMERAGLDIVECRLEVLESVHGFVARIVEIA